MKIAVFFVGELHDGGFNASALAGALAAAAEGLAQITILSGTGYDQAQIRSHIMAALPEHDGLVFIGGQGNLATPDLAAEFPSKRFAIVQGNRLGSNLASYDVRQEESAFLAGCLAARLTQTGQVAHLSGHRVPPGLKGRAAFAAGVAHLDPSVRLLTGFCGTQDDSAITYRWAKAQIAEGADVLFTMLNAARQGAIDACRETGARQIGNALDWVESHGDVFAASAIARIDIGTRQAIKDMARGALPDQVKEFGLAQGDFVRLSLHPDLPAQIAAEMAQIARQIRAGSLTIPQTYQGAEFAPGEAECNEAN
ncbi:MAG: BMP family ABC transporter substrate-binding protein [Mangrovicoccus sp.]|nr:BMP family ABC transporter substrate-binding protein [Mangrovicoccus sp.]